MLVNLRRRLRGDDSVGSAIVVVLVIMLVLTVGGLAVAAIVMSTAGTVVASRGTAQSRAAADAGLSTAVAQLRRITASSTDQNDVCHASVPAGTGPTFTVSVRCTPDDASPTAVEIVSTGRANGSVTKTKAVYPFTVTALGAPASMGGELVSFAGSVTIPGSKNLTMDPSDIKTSMVFPDAAKVDCDASNTTIYGTIIAHGNVTLGCTLNGDIKTEGDVDLKDGSKAFGVVQSGTYNGTTYGGNVVAYGDVKLEGSSRTKVTVSTTLPAAKTLTVNTTLNPATSTRTGMIWRKTETIPQLPLSWYQFQYDRTTDWPDYDYVNLAATSGQSGYVAGLTCSSPNVGVAKKATVDAFWGTYLQGLTKNTVIDDRGCSANIAPSSTAYTTTLPVNVVFLSKGIQLSGRIIKPGTPSVRMWLVVEDTGVPGCGTTSSMVDSEGDIDTVTQNTAISVVSLAYTPCDATISNGASALWTGSVYAGNWVPKGAMDLNLEPLAMPGTTEFAGQFPGSPGGGAGAGGTTLTLTPTPISQRDIP